MRNMRVRAGGLEGVKGLAGDFNQADVTYCPIPDEEVKAGGVIVTDRHGFDAATSVLLLLCLKIVFFVCSSDSHIKKKRKKEK